MKTMNNFFLNILYKTNKMASKEDFLYYPAKKYCSTTVSLGPPRSGKTYIMLKCVKAWLEMGMFEKYVLILPSFKNEADGSYDWLVEHENVFVYESFHEKIAQEIIKEQEENNKLFKEGKLNQRPRVFFCVDDATSQGQDLFKSQTMLTFATQNRHIGCHSWFLMHYSKTILQPKIRQNIMFIFLYPVKKALLKNAYDEYIDFREFDDFDQFKKYWDEKILNQKYGCLLIAGKEKYSPWVSQWFEDEDSEN